jgi:hypothetical protein
VFHSTRYSHCGGGQINSALTTLSLVKRRGSLSVVSAVQENKHRYSYFQTLVSIYCQRLRKPGAALPFPYTSFNEFHRGHFHSYYSYFQHCVTFVLTTITSDYKIFYKIKSLETKYRGKYTDFVIIK